MKLLRALDAPAVDPVERSERPLAAVRALAALAERESALPRHVLHRVDGAPEVFGYLLGAVSGVLFEVSEFTCRPLLHAFASPFCWRSHSRYAWRIVEHMPLKAISRVVLGFSSSFCLASSAGI